MFISLKFCDFSELCQFCCSAGFLPAWCVYTHWHRGKQRKARVRNILKSSGKNTIFNEDPVYPWVCKGRHVACVWRVCLPASGRFLQDSGLLSSSSLPTGYFAVFLKILAISLLLLCRQVIWPFSSSFWQVNPSTLSPGNQAVFFIILACNILQLYRQVIWPFSSSFWHVISFNSIDR